MTQSQLVNAVNDPATVDELLSTLDKIAKDFDHHDLGLPVYDAGAAAQMREAVYRGLS
jgi:hypothetical protein